MRLALFRATLNLPWRLRSGSLSGDGGNTEGTRNSNKLLAVPVPAVLKYLGGESLRGIATMQVTGCSTQPPKLKRVYAGPCLATCGSPRGDSAAASQGLAQSPPRRRCNKMRVGFFSIFSQSLFRMILHFFFRFSLIPSEINSKF